jgi:membrane-associated phospholipid phosphatase
MQFLLIRYFTFCGNFLPQFILSLVLLVIDFEKGFQVGAIWGWGYILNFIIKKTFKKERPPKSEWKVDYVTGTSFPSGHSLTSLVMYWSIVKYFMIPMPWAIILFLIPIGLGLSRLYLGVHFKEDVIAGWIIAFTYLQTLSSEAIVVTKYVFLLFLRPLGINPF